MKSSTQPSCEIHEWSIWPETDGLEQHCSICGKYRSTPQEDKFWLKVDPDSEVVEHKAPLYYRCPYCDAEHDESDVLCCGESGHAEPVYDKEDES